MLLIKQGDQISSSAQGKPENALNRYQKAERLSKQLGNSYLTNITLLKSGIQYAKMGNFKQCRNSYQQVLNYYRLRKDLFNMNKALDFMKDGLGEIKDVVAPIYDEKVYCIEQKRIIDFERKDTLAAIDHLKEMGDNHLNEGKLDLAEKELLNVAASYKAIHFKKIYHTYFLLGAVSHLKGDLQKELYYNIETVKGMLAAHDTSFDHWFYFKLARTYKDLGLYDKSLFYYYKALNAQKAKKMEFGGTLLQVIEVMIAQGKPNEALAYFKQQAKLMPVTAYAYKYVLNQGFADCYVALKQNKIAEQYLLEMIHNQLPFYQTKTQTAEMYLRDFKQVSQFYVSIKNYPQAKYYLDKALALPKSNVSALGLSQLELLNFRVDSAYGKYISAIKHFQRHKRLTDSIFNATKSKQIADLQIHYDLAQKDKNILLLKQQATNENQRLRQRQLVGNMLAAGVVLLLALLALLYSRYRLRQRSILSLKEAQKEVSAKNQVLQKLLHDNEWLLKEVHHRVKNNLHIVMSLLQSQTTYLKDEGALNAVLDSQHRVQAMSLIHQKLYKSANVSSVYMPEYIGELVDYLRNSFKTGLRIVFNLEIEPIVMDVMQAIPVGLILNEIITNSIKYAFPFSEKDTISIKLCVAQDKEIKLFVADNGKGMPPGFNIDDAVSFGLVLIRGLVEDLNGTFLLQGDGGTTLTLVFSINQTDGQAMPVLN